MSGPPDLDKWLAEPALRVVHRRESTVPAAQLWQAAREVRLSDTSRLGRLVRWRIPGLERTLSYDELFRQSPFIALEEGEHALVAGLVGRIWTLRRDYPQLGSPEEFTEWSRGGTARVVIANWAQDRDGGSVLTAEARVEAIGAQGRLGVAAVRPVVRAFQHLVGSDGVNAAVWRAERG